MIRVSAGQAAAAVSLLFLTGCGGQETGDRGGDTGAGSAERAELAVVRVGAPRSDVLLIQADGSDPRPLNVRAALFGSVSWSPDGEEFAFVGAVGGESGNEESDIFVVGAGGSGQRRLTRTGRAFAPVWSPDGETIVFAERRRGRSAFSASLWAIEPDGSDRRVLLEGEQAVVDVPGSFSPDGSRLAFTRSPGTFPTNAEERAAIYVVDVDGGQPEKLVERASAPAFSPDGERIAYVSDVDENGSLSYGDVTSFANELYVMNADGSERRRLTFTRDLNEGAPAWSPDGGVIAYTRGKAFDNAEGFVVMNVASDGRCPRLVAADPGFGVWYLSPDWRPATAPVRRCPEPRKGAGIVRPDLEAPLAKAGAFRDFELFWAGDSLGDLPLADVFEGSSSGPRAHAPVYHLIYRNCEPLEAGSGCDSIEIQLWHACARVPADVDSPADGHVRIRGREGVFFEGGARLEIVSGKTTIVIFSEGRASALAAAQAIRGLNFPLSPREDLPPPEPAAVAGRLRC